MEDLSTIICILAPSFFDYMLWVIRWSDTRGISPIGSVLYYNIFWRGCQPKKDQKKDKKMVDLLDGWCYIKSIIKNNAKGGLHGRS